MELWVYTAFNSTYTSVIMPASQPMLLLSTVMVYFGMLIIVGSLPYWKHVITLLAGLALRMYSVFTDLLCAANASLFVMEIQFLWHVEGIKQNEHLYYKS